jgi:hypothetical protein
MTTFYTYPELTPIPYTRKNFRCCEGFLIGLTVGSVQRNCQCFG